MPREKSPGDSPQEDVLRFLGRAETHGLAAPPIRIDTHGSVVFLAGDEVYKVKRAVRLAFLDYSSLAKRRHFCEREFAINHKLAPTIYKGVVAITRTPKGFEIAGSGEAVEWAVHLRRFDESQTLDHIAESGRLDAEVVRDLAAVVATAHDAAKPVRDGQATEALAGVIEETQNALLQAVPLFPRADVEAFNRTMRATFCDVRGLLMTREATGHVRHCHGDMHLRNIVLLDGKPTLFDAIEFDDKIATTDTLYDLAFLLMDLWEKRLDGAANEILNRYLWLTHDLIDELNGLSALPVFLSLRAAIRAKVAALSAAASPPGRQSASEARRYFETAREFLKPGRPFLIAVGGRSGTGKSTLARALAPAIGRAPGAIHLRSDIERKRQFQVAETARLPSSAYEPEVSHRIYEALDRQARTALQAGQSVIVDATFLSDFERNAVAAVGLQAGADFRGLWLEAPTGLLIDRLATRVNDASDATPAIVRRQKVTETPPGWIRLDAAKTPTDLREVALKHLQPESRTTA